jgi:hypothetical protein
MKLYALVVTATIFAAGKAHALEASVTKESVNSADKVWAAVGDFCGIAQWHPAVAKCVQSEKDGATYRTLTLKDGAQLLEKLINFDKAAMTYSYTIEEGPLPVANYKSTLSVKPKDKGSAILWTGTFDAKGAPDADAVKTITGIYEAGATALQTK